MTSLSTCHQLARVQCDLLPSSWLKRWSRSSIRNKHWKTSAWPLSTVLSSLIKWLGTTPKTSILSALVAIGRAFVTWTEQDPAIIWPSTLSALQVRSKCQKVRSAHFRSMTWVTAETCPTWTSHSSSLLEISKGPPRLGRIRTSRPSRSKAIASSRRAWTRSNPWAIRCACCRSLCRQRWVVPSQPIEVVATVFQRQSRSVSCRLANRKTKRRRGRLPNTRLPITRSGASAPSILHRWTHLWPSNIAQR